MWGKSGELVIFRDLEVILEAWEEFCGRSKVWGAEAEFGVLGASREVLALDFKDLGVFLGSELAILEVFGVFESVLGLELVDLGDLKAVLAKSPAGSMRSMVWGRGER